MKRLLLLSVAALLLAGSADAFAQGRYRVRYNDRQDGQRVRRGIRSGQITRDEAREIRERERQIRDERRGYRAGGTVTRDERREIRRDERDQDRFIRQQRHDNDRNDRRRGNGYYRRGAGSPSHPVFGRRNRY
jgi:hypothetical protein